MKKPEHTHYLIKLKNGRYLCHENSKNACIYKYTETERLRYDLNMSRGELVALTPAREVEVYAGIQYDNTNRGINAMELREELIGLSNYTSTLGTYQEGS